MSNWWDEFKDQTPRKLSTGEDVRASGLSGLVQGSAQLLGTPGDMLQLAKTGVQAGVGAAEKRGFAPKGSGEFMAAALRSGGPPGPMKTVGDLSRTALVTAIKAGGGGQQTASAAGNMIPGALRAPTTKDIEQVAGKPKYHKPQTTAGEYARTIGQFAPAALMPGSAPSRLANVLVPAVTSETAGQFTKGSDIEPYARIAGALAGGGAVALANQPRPTTRMLAEGARGASDDQIRLAQALREDASARGVTLTQAEAVQQAAGGATGLGRLQRVLEGTQAGSERLTPIMSQRPGQVRGAVTQFADNIAPPTTNPSMIGGQAQEAADGVLTGVRQQINANARPFYDALPTEQMPVAAPAYQNLVQTPAYAEALANVRGNPILNGPIAHLPDESLAVVDEVVKQLDTLGQNARPNPAASTGNARMSAAYDAARGTADELAGAYSEPWNLGRGMVRSQREAFLEPLQRGPMGALSATDDVGAQTRALFPAQPLEGAPAETERAIAMLMEQNPGVAPDLIRQHVMNTLNETTQNLQSGANQWGGAKFAATIAGNPEQAATLRAGIDAAAPGQGPEFARLTEILEATGKRQAPGSLTAYNVEDLKKLGETGALGQVASTGLNPPGFFRKMGDAFYRFNAERNAADLTESLLADPARASEILLEARRTVPPGAQLETIERLAITAMQGRREGGNLPAVRP